MEGDTKRICVFEDSQSVSHDARIERSHSDGKAVYWGVLCRTCRELVAFDIPPYASFGPEAASMKPGAIRCARGHNHIYFPRDFQFIPSAVSISDAVMLENRDAYSAINRVSPALSGHLTWTDTEPEAIHEVPAPPSSPISPRPPISLASDPRRETAEAAAKQRWTIWAGKKAM